MRVRVRVPATSANLGPGFDALGLALALYNEVTLEEADRVSVAVEGEGSGRLDAGAKNVVARGAALAFEIAGRAFPGARLRCVNRIPLSRGLGSSAEGHPDNVAAALLGGLTVSCADGPRVTAVSLAVPREIEWVVLVPETESSTREARAVLPESVPRVDAIFNVQRVSLFLAALAAGRVELLALAMQDRLHQPYRLRLFPWMDAVAAAGREAGALGCVLGGAAARRGVDRPGHGAVPPRRRDRGSGAPPAGRRERCDVGTASPDLTRRLGRQYDLIKVYP